MQTRVPLPCVFLVCASLAFPPAARAAPGAEPSPPQDSAEAAPPGAAADPEEPNAEDGTSGGGDAAEISPKTLADAKRLYEEGKAHYEMLDYERAIEKWTKAYALVPESERGRPIRNALVYNIAQAQEKAFEIDGDVTRLKQARGLLQRYLEEHEALYGDDPQAVEERSEVAARIEELEEKIAASDRGEGPSAADRRRAARELQRKRKAIAVQLLEKDPTLQRRYKKGKSMVIAGGVLVGVGALGLLGAAAVAGGDTPLGWRPGLAAGLFVTGGAAFVSGVVVLPIGAVRMEKARKEAYRRATVRLAPVLGPHGAGLTLAGRF